MQRVNLSHEFVSGCSQQAKRVEQYISSDTVFSASDHSSSEMFSAKHDSVNGEGTQLPVEHAIGFSEGSATGKQEASDTSSSTSGSSDNTSGGPNEPHITPVQATFLPPANFGKPGAGKHKKHGGKGKKGKH